MTANARALLLLLLTCLLGFSQQGLALTVGEMNCQHPDTGEEEACVAPEECASLPRLLADDMRGSRLVTHCGSGPSDIKVCCPGPVTSVKPEDYAMLTNKMKRAVPLRHHVAKPAVTAAPDPINIQPSAKPGSGATPAGPSTSPAVQFDAPIPVGRDHKKAYLLDMEKCGSSSVNLIVHGSRAAREQLPWMALLCYTDELGRGVCGCGGSLINANYVLTAAHCVTKLPNGFKLAFAVLGELDQDTNPDCDGAGQCSAPVQVVAVDHATPHPCYDEAHMLNDVALVRLARPANLSTESVTPVCLPLGDLQLKNLDGVTKMIVAGWGLTDTGSSSSQLMYVGLPVVPNAQCAKVYESEPVCVAPSVFCAGGGKEDSCNGDSGGPITMLDSVTQADGTASTRMVQVGLVSYGPAVCGTLGVPAVYTRIGHHLKWILDTMEP